MGGRALAGRYGLQIRTATSTDGPGVAALMQGAGGGASASSWAERIEALRHGNGAVLLALEWGPPSGLIVMHWLRLLHSDHPVGQISTLVVAPDERRRGIARLLLKAGAQAARLAGCGSVHLVALGDDETVPAFARASGFDRSGSLFVRPLRKASTRV